ncbi:protein SAWADEE HOMEODOMAIN HOMOLOG 1-like isoform X2 [Vigna unguiculata]|uniref:protein SAWADEE HOMEODOMAIN HOMOLOG 1-like isoform X2 n=1 Tax=Vigna unguiculata TaxID=3917 RepID=UPI00101643C0|nr:protein SAWADEE HOMEODOMAIN HOMOLOG 1-like isoform X2 [Vigna unguiculata]
MDKSGLTEQPFPKLSSDEVEQWFKGRQRVSQNKDSSSSSKGRQATDISELGFEARSTKDIAWHDVALFSNYRVLCSGELEVRVRYAGFAKEQDEWVNVKLGVRARSIPLEPSECQKVQDGNLILCFLERDDYALYCDARVVKIQRRVHDPTECTCTFFVRYLHDQSEDRVSWNRICCRPTEEKSAVYPVLALHSTQSSSPTFSLNPIESLWG